MTDNDILKEALIQACTELLYTRKYGSPLPGQMPPLTHAEAQEVRKLYDHFFDEAVNVISQA